MIELIISLEKTDPERNFSATKRNKDELNVERALFDRSH